MPLTSFCEIITLKNLRFFKEGYLIDKIIHKVHCEQWTNIIKECLASGMNKTAWCREHGISDKSFFCWQRRLREEAYILTIDPSLPRAVKSVTIFECIWFVIATFTLIVKRTKDENAVFCGGLHTNIRAVAFENQLLELQKRIIEE